MDWTTNYSENSIFGDATHNDTMDHQPHDDHHARRLLEEKSATHEEADATNEETDGGWWAGHPNVFDLSVGGHSVTPHFMVSGGP